MNDAPDAVDDSYSVDEDNVLTREVQRGLETSAYDVGILSNKEVLVRHFQDWVRERLPVA